MSYQDYLPARLIRNCNEHQHPFVSLRKEVDSLFDSFGSGFFGGHDEVVVRANVSKTDTEFCISAELRGMTEADVDIFVIRSRISIKSEEKLEKKERSDEKGREFHQIEKTSGAIQRIMTLPFNIDADTVKATAQGGTLTVAIPKPAEAVANTEKIKVEHAELQKLCV